MRIAVIARKDDPFSFRIYREQLSHQLSELGIAVIPFTEAGPVPTADIVWDPGLAGARIPPPILRSVKAPLVATVHGAAIFSMRWRDRYADFSSVIRVHIRKIRAKTAWRRMKSRFTAFIAVSRFGAQEVTRAFNFRPDTVHPVYHGVDHTVFRTEGETSRRARPYFLHVSRGVPKKNNRRLIEAYRSLPEHNRPDFVLVLPGYQEDVEVKGITVVRDEKAPIELASLYRGSSGFIFPSLHETFGMPILEAMACGCPVITANNTACAEISGDAALLVNPYSVREIADAMRRLIEHEPLRLRLRRKGLERSRSFTWRRSAEEHITVFRKIVEQTEWNVPRGPLS